MSLENRLTTEQLAALAAGDSVVIETSGGVRRPSYAPGTVVRLSGPNIVVSTPGARGGTYLEHFGRRDGVRVGGARRAELVNPDGMSAMPSGQRRQAVQIDALHREWKRNRADVDALRKLHAAIDEYLAVEVQSSG